MSSSKFSLRRHLTREEVAQLIALPLDSPIPGRLLSSYLPLLSTEHNIDKSSLTTRVHNTLKRLKALNRIANIGDISNLTVAKLLSLENFGRKSLVHLLTALEPIVVDMEPQILVKQPSPAIQLDEPLTRFEVLQFLQAPETYIGSNLRIRRLPRIAPSFRVADISVPVRVQKCMATLKRAYGIDSLSQLTTLTIDNLLNLKNFGRKSLVVLLSAVLPLIIEEDSVATRPITDTDPGRSKSVTIAAERLRSQPYAKRIYCTDPRFKPEMAALLTIANSSSADPPLSTSSSLHSLAHRLASRSRDPLPEAAILSIVKEVRTKVARTRQLSLERELKDLMGTLVTGRNLKVLIRLFGCDGSGARTLQEVGDEFLVTRERVRQIAHRATKELKSARPFLPALRKAIELIDQNMPAPVEQISRKLSEQKITQTQFQLEGVEKILELLGYPIPFAIEEHRGLRTAVSHEDLGVSKFILRLANRAITHVGAAKLSAIASQLEEQRGISRVNTSVVSHVLQSQPSLHWLDEEKEWFYMASVPRNHLITIVRKILSVASRIHVNEMRAAIAEDLRGMGFAPPKTVVMEFCRHACDCDVDSDFIIARVQPQPTQVLSRSELIIYSIFREGGPLLHRTELERRCAKAGMNSSTFTSSMHRLSIVERYGPGIYGLRGAAIGPGDVERCVPVQTRRLHDYGWTDSAMPWIAIELSQANLSSGSVGIPAAIQRFVEGRYLMRLSDSTELGDFVVSKSSGWGLKPLFERTGGEPGDMLILMFDLRRHEAIAQIGTTETVFRNFGEQP